MGNDFISLIFTLAVHNKAMRMPVLSFGYERNSISDSGTKIG